MQKVMITGNLGNDPEMRYTGSGVAVTNFSVAVTKKYTAADGQKVEETTWFRVSAWRGQAEVCNQYLSKGSKVLVIGELKSEIDVYQKRDGSHSASYELTAREVEFLGGGNGNSGHAGSAPGESSSFNDTIDEDEIPF
jgi:single-strand DNA-binding protein